MNTGGKITGKIDFGKGGMFGGGPEAIVPAAAGKAAAEAISAEITKSLSSVCFTTNSQATTGFSIKDLQRACDVMRAQCRKQPVMVKLRGRADVIREVIERLKRQACPETQDPIHVSSPIFAGVPVVEDPDILPALLYCDMSDGTSKVYYWTGMRLIPWGTA